jgi:drug/metabolite transporter (DMT)-like permease
VSQLDIAAWGLVLLAVADWGATVRLIAAALKVKGAALEERAMISVILSVAASIAAIMSLAYLAHFQWPPGVGTLLLLVALMLISLPQLLWYAAYRAGRFK